MALWKDLISIPTEVHRNDFVLRLTEGVQDAKKQHTVDTYVVTPQIADRFDMALGLIRSAVDSNKSVAAYLHGSFGSGKSHFMAVLNLLLEGFPAARKVENLGPVVAKHQEWMDQNRFLMVPYHFMNATSMETAILGGYVEYVRRHHPNTPIPGVYLAEKIFDNADTLRTQIGDERFFDILNGGAKAEPSPEPAPTKGKWGKLEGEWDAETYKTAREGEPGSEKLTRLVGDVVARLLPATMDTARVGQHGFVDLDEGLETISRHAATLTAPGSAGKYTGLILFLDELVLWLASRAGDMDFLNREGPKVSKLIEAQYADRPLPIISFVAKQRDLRDFIGDDHLGIEQFRVSEQLQYWDRGLDTIKLEDRNLPVIVKQRLLKPVDGLAAENVRQSFNQTTTQMKPAARDIMLGHESDEEMFAAVYPFSPVLVQALIALSALLHRERTALRLLLMLLVRRRDDLELGQIIPVGDLWDVISEQQEPFSDVILQTFRSAQRLYDNRLRPMLIQEHGFDPDKDENPDKAPHFRNDDRIIKTLLISTLVPGVEAFKEMTAERLVALNYGAVKTPIPGAETSALVQKLRRWAGVVGEIRMGEDAGNPTVTLQLSDVDLDALLKRVQSQDSEGNRRRKLQELLFGWFGLELGTQLITEYTLDWRGGRRHVQVSYRNIREMSLEHLESDGERWQLVIDYPFDEDGKTPADDSAKLQAYGAKYPGGTDTIGWLPSFLSAAGTEALGRLVRIDYVLERFERQTEHLAASDRPTVRAALSSQRSTIREQLKQAMRVAYGVDADPQNHLVDHINKPPQHLYSLRHGFNPRVPAGMAFDAALRGIVETALEARYPDAPRLPHEAITKGRVQKIADAILEIIESGEAGGFIDKGDLRKEMKAWAEPLELGEMGDNRFAPSRVWRDRFNRALSTGDPDIQVRELRRALEPDDGARGLPRLLQDLVILVYAAQENLVFRIGGEVYDPSIGQLEDSARLVHRKMPSDAAWTRACEIARIGFDVTPGRMKNARNVERLVTDINRAVDEQLKFIKQLPEKLVEVAVHLDMDREAVERSDRHRIASQLVEATKAVQQDAADAIEMLANLELTSNDLAAMQLTVMRANSMFERLKNTQWKLFDKVRELGSPIGEGLIRSAQEVLRSRETEEKLETLRGLSERAIEVMGKPASPIPQPAKPSADWTREFLVEGDPDYLAAQISEAVSSDDHLRAMLKKGARVQIFISEKN